jgi:hypothetical protein
LSVQVFPSAGLGADGDFYLQTDITGPGDVYEKIGGLWTLQYTLAVNGVGPQGPAGADGADGADGLNGADGAEWFSVPGVLGNGVGDNGDWYINITNGDYYNKAAGIWGLQGNLQGADGSPGVDGTDGSVWYTNTGAPAPGLGQDGDYYLNTTNGDYYIKAGINTWALLGNLTGPAGPAARSNASYKYELVLNTDGRNTPFGDVARGGLFLDDINEGLEYYIGMNGDPSLVIEATANGNIGIGVVNGAYLNIGEDEFQLRNNSQQSLGQDSNDDWTYTDNRGVNARPLRYAGDYSNGSNIDDRDILDFGNIKEVYNTNGGVVNITGNLVAAATPNAVYRLQGSSTVTFTPTTSNLLPGQSFVVILDATGGGNKSVQANYNGGSSYTQTSGGISQVLVTYMGGALYVIGGN